MKLILIIFVFFQCNSLAYAQHWDLFPLHQQSLYTNYFGYEDIRRDSTITSNSGAHIYFNPRIYNNSCFNDSVIQADFYGGYFLVPTNALIVDSISIFSCVRSMDTAKFVFKQHAKIGDTWQISQGPYWFRCDSIRYRLVFGEFDSVKYFSVNKNGSAQSINHLGFVLSKNNGLIKFSSIQKLAFSDTLGLRSSDLLGYRKLGLRKGKVLPDFNDYFKLHAGDVLIWKHHYDDFDIRIPDVIYYYKDSILSASHSTDSVKYKIERNLNGQKDEHEVLYTRKEFEQYLRINPSYLTFSNWNPIYQSSEDIFTHWRLEEFSLDTGYSNLAYYCYGSFHNNNDCSINIMLDVGYAFSFNSKIGLASYEVFGFVFKTTDQVVGSIIDGVHSGITSIPVGLSVENKLGTAIYPNPSNGVLYIKSDIEPESLYQIIDLNGTIINQGKLSSSIDVNHLKDGLYTLQIFNKSQFIHHTFLKLSN